VKRREFITLLGGATACPLPARAQQPDGMRRIAALMDTDDSNSDGQTRVAALRQTLQQLGWTEGRNMRLDLRWGGGDVARTRAGPATSIIITSPS
jgi:putative ABC transport system substrate-binding protein